MVSINSVLSEAGPLAELDALSDATEYIPNILAVETRLSWLLVNAAPIRHVRAQPVAVIYVIISLPPWMA